MTLTKPTKSMKVKVHLKSEQLKLLLLLDSKTNSRVIEISLTTLNYIVVPQKLGFVLSREINLEKIKEICHK